MVKSPKSWLSVVNFILAIVAINIVAQSFYTRFDFTKEKRYTLNQKTKETLEKTKKDITITVFLDGEIPAAFRRLSNATKDLLNDYKAYANANVKVIFAGPLKDVSASEQNSIIEKYIGVGIKPMAVNIKNDAGLTQKIIFPMALIQYGEKQIPINLLQKTGGAATDYEENITSSIQNLEYAFTSGIKRLLKGSTPQIGFTEGHGEPDNLYLNDAISALSPNYLVGRVDLNLMNKEGLDSLKVLFIVKPKKPFTELEKYKINYFVMKGGRLIWSIDQVNAELDSLQNKGQILASNLGLNLDDMLFEYGARINYNLVKDLNSSLIPVAIPSAGQQTQIDMAPWLYYPVLIPDTSNSLVKNIDGIRSQFTSTVDTIGIADVNKQIILRTSSYNSISETPKMLSLQTVAEQPTQQEYASTAKAIGVLLEGSFKSVFFNRPVPVGITENYNLPANSKLAKMIVLGDGDIFINQVSKTDGMSFPLGFDRYTQQNYGNKALLLNIADYFTDDDNLIALRNKEIKVRLLDKVLLRTDKTKWQLINAIFPLLMLICFATFQHYYRKYKYAK